MSQIVNLEDVGCPICLEILVEPITMPCKHTICKECFEKTIELANTVCPMCKKRISIWCRKAKKVENLIDVRLWDKIKNQFPDLVSARVSGEGSSEGLFEFAWTHDICENGVIRKEYEEQIETLRKEKEARDRAEEELSKKLIEEMLKKDELDISQHTSEASNASSLSNSSLKTKPTSPVKQFIKPVQPDHSNRQSFSDKSILKQQDQATSLGGCTLVVEAVVERYDSPKSPSLLSDFFGWDEISDLSPEFLDEQVKLEESFTREKEDEELARRLQDYEAQNVSSSPSSSLKRSRSGPRQATLRELFASSKRQKL